MERVADYIIRRVNEAGAGHVFMITGRGILYLTDAVARNERIDGISTYHEQGASYAAMAYASASEGISTCLVSTGCAATNAVTAALCAYQDNLPIVFLSGNNQRSETTRYTGIPIRTYGSQEADIIKIVQSITKYAVMLTDKDCVVYEVEKALHLAREGRKGPVWIDIPLDVQNMRIDTDTQKKFVPPDELSLVQSMEIDEVLHDLHMSKRPVLLIGGGAKSSYNEVKDIVERCNIPLVFSPTAADVYGTSHERSIGAVGSLGGTRAGNFAVQNADYILAVGTKLSSQETGMKASFARDARIAVVDIDRNEHTKEGVHIDQIINADAKYFLTELLKHNIRKSSDEWIKKCIHWKEIFSIRNETFIEELQRKDRLDIYTLTDILSDCLPKDATIITDAGFEELIVPSTIRFQYGQRCLFPASQGAMGYSIPAILGAHAAGRTNIVCIVGDGSFMMNMQELQIIKERGIRARIFVINNNMYAVIRKRQKDLFRERTIGNDPSDGVPAPNFKKIAESFGIRYYNIDSRQEWIQRIKGILVSDETIICEVACTPNQQYLHESYAVNEKKRLIHRPIEDMAPFLDREVLRREMIVDMLE